MIAREKPIVGLYVEKTCPEQWIVRDHQGQFWMVGIPVADGQFRSLRTCGRENTSENGLLRLRADQSDAR
jgi:hypothetical protein